MHRATERTEPCYAGLRNDPALAALWDDNLAARGRTIDTSPPPSGGSTDMGNVSLVVPAIHAMVSILGATGIPHNEEFAADAGSPAADEALMDGAAAIIGTVVDAASDPVLRAELLRRQAERVPGSTAVRLDV